MKKFEFETSKGRFCLVDNPMLPQAMSITTKYIKLSEITEEQASEIVKMTWISDNPNLCEFKNYNINGNGSFSSAIESLHSILKSKGIHLFENPLQSTKPTEDLSFYDNQNDVEIVFNQWQEAEEKTFYNPYIFKL